MCFENNGSATALPFMSKSPGIKINMLVLNSNLFISGVPKNVTTNSSTTVQLVTTNSSPDLPRPLQDQNVGCFYVIEERSKDFQEVLSNISRQARSLMQHFSDSNVQLIEQQMLDRRPCESGILSMRMQSSS